MTVIAYRAGVMAADSRATITTEEGGIRMMRSDKLYTFDGHIVGVAGEGFPALVFVEWLKKGGNTNEPPELLIHGDADFSALVLTRKGLFEYDKWCRPERVKERFWAIGCGAKGALCAMHAGATAYDAVKFVCKVDPLCGPPIITRTL